MGPILDQMSDFAFRCQIMYKKPQRSAVSSFLLFHLAPRLETKKRGVHSQLKPRTRERRTLHDADITTAEEYSLIKIVQYSPLTDWVVGFSSYS